MWARETELNAVEKLMLAADDVDRRLEIPQDRSRLVRGDGECLASLWSADRHMEAIVAFLYVDHRERTEGTCFPAVYLFLPYRRALGLSLGLALLPFLSRGNSRLPFPCFVYVALCVLIDGHANLLRSCSTKGVLLCFLFGLSVLVAASDFVFAPMSVTA